MITVVSVGDSRVVGLRLLAKEEFSIIRKVLFCFVFKGMKFLLICKGTGVLQYPLNFSVFLEI